MPGCIFYPTCLMFKRGGEQRLYFYPFLSRKKSDRMINCQSASCRIDQKSSASHNLVQRWLQFVILNLYWSHQPPASTFWEKTDSAEVGNFRLNLLCWQKIMPELSQIQYSTILIFSFSFHHSFVLFIVLPQSSQKYLSRQ